MNMRFVPFVLVASLASCDGQTTISTPKPAYRSTDEIVQSLGYDAVALPSTAYGPGSLVTSVKGYGFSQPLHLTYLCRPEYAKAPPPIIDTGATGKASQALDNSFKLDLSVLKLGGLGASAAYVDSVTVNFQNVKVEQLAFDDLAAVQEGLGPRCRVLLDKFSKKGLARQTQQALRADVTYTAHLKRGASAEVKNLVTKALQTSFGGSIEQTGDNAVIGQGLYYGLLLNDV